jgi:hypothetical protein
MKRKSIQKLTLKKETVINLTVVMQVRVAGGIAPSKACTGNNGTCETCMPSCETCIFNTCGAACEPVNDFQ